MNPEKNLWFDFGEGKGGNIFALAGEFIKTGGSGGYAGTGLWTAKSC